MAAQRVLHVLKLFRPSFSGHGVFLERISAVLDACEPGVEHDLLVTDTLRPAAAPAVAPALQDIIYLQDRQRSDTARELVLLRWMAINLHRYAVIHFHTHVDRYFIAYFMARLLGRHIVLSATLDDSIPGLVCTYRPSLRPLATRLFKVFDDFIAISPKLNAENARVVDIARTHMVPIGVNVPDEPRRNRERTRAKLAVPSDNILLVFLGGICDRKDPLFLVENMPAILARHSNVMLLLAGPVLEQNHYRKIQTAIRNGGLEPHVIFTGEVSDPCALFAAADIMTFASRMEGFGTAVTEAMTHEVPPVVRRLPGVNDLFISQGESGFLFDTPKEYVSAVCRLISDSQLRMRLGRAARATVLGRFDNVTNARRYLEIYCVGTTTPSLPCLPAAGSKRRALTIQATASICNPRFRRHVAFPGQQTPLLLTTIDAEESFDWSAPFTRETRDVTSMRKQYLAHRIFERYKIVPLYLATHPVATAPDGLAPIMGYFREGLCDIGAQLHAWSTPPFEESVNVANSFQGNLPRALEFEKIATLTDAIAARTGRIPAVFRAGRYGAGMRTADYLKQLGYRIDSSVLPHFNFSHERGPDFRRFDSRPFWTDARHSLLELPLTCGIVGALSREFSTGASFLFEGNAALGPFRWMSARTGLMERIKLSPEGTTIDEAKRLVYHMLHTGVRVFVLSYHSPSLVPGYTPYVRSQADLDRFLAWLDKFYAFFLGEIGGCAALPMQVYELAKHLQPAISSSGIDY